MKTPSLQNKVLTSDIKTDRGLKRDFKQSINTQEKIGLTAKQASQVMSGRCIGMHVGSKANGIGCNKIQDLQLGGLLNGFAEVSRRYLVSER